jgi:hypothetical protein
LLRELRGSDFVKRIFGWWKLYYFLTTDKPFLLVYLMT